MNKRFYSKSGERNLNSKTNPRDVALIRFLGRYKPWSVRKLGTEFSLSPGTVHKILHGQTWLDVDVDQEIQTLLKYAQLVQELSTNGVHGRDRSEPPAERMESVRSTPYVVESKQPFNSQNTKVNSLADILADLGINHVADLTNELFHTLDQDRAKQRILWLARSAWLESEAA